MKRNHGLLIPLLALCLCLLLSACGGGKAPQSAPTEAPAQAETPAETEAPAKTEAPAQAAEPAKAEEAPKAEPQTAAEPAPAEAPAPAEPAGVSPLVGSWLYYSQEGVNGGQTVTHAEVEQYRAQGYGAMIDMVLTINADGTCRLLWLGELSDGTWTDNGDGTGTMQMEGKTMTLSVKDGMLISTGDDNVSSFEKTDRTAG